MYIWEKKQKYGKKTRSRWKLWEKRRGKHGKKINEGSKKEKNCNTLGVTP
jgi:hypothetical protein